jgi:hypothetical protein
MGTGCHVLLEDPTQLSLRTGEVARVIAKALGEPVADVAQRVRYGGGIVARDLDPETANAIAAQLGESNLAAFVVPGAAVEALPRPRRTSGLPIDEDGLRLLLRGVQKRPEKLAWGRIRAVHVNALARDLAASEIEEGRKPRPIADVESAPDDVKRLSSEIDYWEDREKTKRIDLCLDLLAEEPVLVARLTAEDADYSELPGKRLGSLENFVIFVRALLAKLPRPVVVPPTTRAFADRCDWQAVLLDKPEQRDAFNLWLLAAVRNGHPFGIDPEEEELSDEEVIDDDEEDEEEGEEDEAEEAAEEEADVARSAAENVKAAGGDLALAEELALFDKTRKFSKKDILAAAEEAARKKALAEPPPASPDKTGRWDVSQLMDETKDLEDKDL